MCISVLQSAGFPLALLKVAEISNSYCIRNGGNGLSSQDIARLFDIKRPLRSSKHWRRGQRGALGNGSRVALAGCSICKIDLTITLRCKQYHIKLLDNGDTVITTQDTDVADAGTRILLGFPNDKTFRAGRYRTYVQVARAKQGYVREPYMV